MAESYITRKGGSGGVEILETLEGNYNAPKTSHVSLPMLQGQYSGYIARMWVLQDRIYTVTEALSQRYLQTWTIQNGQLALQSNDNTSSQFYGGIPFYSDGVSYYTSNSDTIMRWNTTSGYPTFTATTTNMRSYAGLNQAAGGLSSFGDSEFLYGAVYGNNAGIVKYHRNNMAYNTHKLYIFTFSQNYNVGIYPFASDQNYLYAFRFNSSNGLYNGIVKFNKTNLDTVAELSIQNLIGLSNPSIEAAQIVNNKLYAVISPTTNRIFSFDISGTNLSYINNTPVNGSGQANGLHFDGNYIYTSMSGRLFTLNKDNLSTINGAFIHGNFNLNNLTRINGNMSPFTSKRYIPYAENVTLSGFSIKQLDLKEFTYNNANYIAIPK